MEDVSEVFNAFVIEFTFLGFCIQTMLAQAAKDLFDLFTVSSFVRRINENVVEIDDDTNV